VCVVMHIPASEPSQLATILQRRCAMSVAAAVDGEALLAGRVYVGTPNHHLMVHPDEVRVTFGPKECDARPSVDVLFRSAAAAQGARVIGVVLSGALDDGTAGAWAIKDRGGRILIEDPATARFPSMPDSVARHVAVDAALPAALLAQRIVEYVRSLQPVPNPEIPHQMQLENRIAREGVGLDGGVLSLGPVSKLACPECHGVMVELRDGATVRYRCHTGHAYSKLSLLGEIEASIHASLWQAVRATDERVLLLREMAGEAAALGQEDVALRYGAMATLAAERLQPLRAVASDRSFSAGAGLG